MSRDEEGDALEVEVALLFMGEPRYLLRAEAERIMRFQAAARRMDARLFAAETRISECARGLEWAVQISSGRGDDRGTPTRS